MSIFDIQTQNIVLPDSTTQSLGAIQHFKELTAGAGSNVFKVNKDGMFLGATAFASAPFRVNYNGAVVASNITITGGSISGAIVSGLGAGSLLNIQGWTFSGVFSATDSDTIAWTSGTITLGDGTTFSISAGNTGNISALTYIYLDTAVSTTVLQTTTTSGTAVGANKILVAVGQNETGKNATFQAFGGKGVGQLITAANIATNTITANEIATNTITANNMNVSTLSSISANIGTITAGTIYGTTIQSSSGNQRVVLNTGDYLEFYYNNTQTGYLQMVGLGSLTLEADSSFQFNLNGTDKIQISIDGHIYPLANATMNCGGISNHWANVFADNYYAAGNDGQTADDSFVTRVLQSKTDGKVTNVQIYTRSLAFIGGILTTFGNESGPSNAE